MGQGEHGVVFRGRLRLEDAGQGQPFAYLELDGVMIGLGGIEGLPDGVSDTWVELRVDPGHVENYPYAV